VCLLYIQLPAAECGGAHSFIVPALQPLRDKTRRLECRHSPLKLWGGGCGCYTRAPAPHPQLQLMLYVPRFVLLYAPPPYMIAQQDQML